MYRIPLHILTLVLFVNRWARGLDTITDNQRVYCPSYCDEEGYYHTSKYCILHKEPFCCLVKERLNCCNNGTFSVTNGIKDDYNCYPNLGWLAYYWKTILGVCLPLGVISVVGAVTLCSIQHIRTRRRQRQAQIERERSDSGISSISGTSSVSSRSTLRAPPSPIVVMTSGNESPSLERLRVHGLRFPMKPPPYTADKPPPYAFDEYSC